MISGASKGQVVRPKDGPVMARIQCGPGVPSQGSDPTPQNLHWLKPYKFHLLHNQEVRGLAATQDLRESSPGDCEKPKLSGDAGCRRPAESPGAFTWDVEQLKADSRPCPPRSTNVFPCP